MASARGGLGNPRKPYNALPGWESPEENGLGDPGAQLGRFQGIGPQPYGQLDAWAGLASSAKVGGEGTSRASSLRFGRKGDKGPRAAGPMGGTKRLRRSPTAPEVPGWAQAGALQGGAGCATWGCGDLPVLAAREGPWEGPGTRLAPASRPIGG